VSVDAARLAAWLGTRDAVVEGSPSGGGWSNETVFVRAGERSLVVRLTPPGPSMFPIYDLVQQVRCLQLAAEHGLPVPAVLGAEPDPDVLGRPFFVMERLAGRVPADDDPPFTKAGFLFDARPAQQQTFCQDAIDHVVAVHAIEPPDFLPVGPAPADHLQWCAELCRWAGVEHPEVWAAHDALVRDVPPAAAAPVSLLWGDARPANMLVGDDFRVVGLLDWELAGTGPGELDIAWFCEMNHMRSEGMGVPPLAGFLSDAATWERWSVAVGRPATHVEWHQRYAAYRVAVLLFLYVRAMILVGRVPADHRMLRDNVGTRRLHALFS
jgi:aminoglycoside phosphotransferase (APT) family kinase protein